MRIIKYILFTLTIIVSLNSANFVVSAQGKDERITGSVKWFSGMKGYGFITRDDGREDVFVNSKAIQDSPKTLSEGQKVSFKVIKNNGSWSAGEVKKEK